MLVLGFSGEPELIHENLYETPPMLASGYVVGWVQGRSKFGPRALGNRSILADPRPSENKARINKIATTISELYILSGF